MTKAFGNRCSSFCSDRFAPQTTYTDKGPKVSSLLCACCLWSPKVTFFEPFVFFFSPDPQPDVGRFVGFDHITFWVGNAKQVSVHLFGWGNFVTERTYIGFYSPKDPNFVDVYFISARWRANLVRNMQLKCSISDVRVLSLSVLCLVSYLQ